MFCLALQFQTLALQVLTLAFQFQTLAFQFQTLALRFQTLAIQFLALERLPPTLTLRGIFLAVQSSSLACQPAGLARFDVPPQLHPKPSGGLREAQATLLASYERNC